MILSRILLGFFVFHLVVDSVWQLLKKHKVYRQVSLKKTRKNKLKRIVGRLIMNKKTTQKQLCCPKKQ